MSSHKNLWAWHKQRLSVELCQTCCWATPFNSFQLLSQNTLTLDALHFMLSVNTYQSNFFFVAATSARMIWWLPCQNGGIFTSTLIPAQRSCTWKPLSAIIESPCSRNSNKPLSLTIWNSDANPSKTGDTKVMCRVELSQRGTSQWCDSCSPKMLQTGENASLVGR